MKRSLYIAALLVCLLSAIPVIGSSAQEVARQDEGGSIKGTVVGAGERPLASAQVDVRGQGISESLLTSADGTFEVKVPKVGSYTIQVDAPGHRPARVGARVEQVGQTATPVIRLSPTSLRVRVFSEGSKQPLANVSLTLVSDETKKTWEGRTDSSGTYYFGELPRESYSIIAVLTGYDPMSETVLIVSSEEMSTLNMAMSKGSSLPISGAREKFGTPERPLPSDEVHTIFQDENGYVWFGTDRGIARFDGTNIDSSDGLELAHFDDMDVRAIAQFDGALWFGGASGLVRFDGAAVRIPQFQGTTVTGLAVDRSGNAWIATNAGVFTGRGVPFSRVAEGSFTSVFVDPEGTVWAAGEAGVLRVSGSVATFEDLAESPGFDGDAVRVVFRSSSGTVLFGTHHGLFQRGENGVEPFLAEQLNGGVTCIAEDVRGNLWIGSESGALLYNTRRQVTKREFSGERINALMSDREGNFWFATEQGAIRWDLYSFISLTPSDGLIGSSVVCIAPDTRPEANEAIWLVTSGGVQQRSVSGDFTLYTDLDAEAEVRHMLCDADGTRWFATSKGVYRQGSGEPQQLSDLPATWLARSEDGRMWAILDSAVHLLDERAFAPVPNLAQYSPSKIFTIGEDLWLATDDGAVRFNPQALVVEAVDVSHGVEGEGVRWVASDRDGRIWLATDFGVEILDARSFNKLDGNADVARGSDERTIMRDAEGFMWVGSANGSVRKIAFFEGGVAETTFTSMQAGIAGSLVNAIVQDVSGAIWFATDLGATRHLPVKVLPVIVPTVEVDGRAIAGDEVIPAGQHTIRFQFQSVTTLGDVRYLYRLVGDEAWQQMPDREELTREVAYTDFESGDHVFELRVLNRDLYGIDAPPLQMHLRIDRPIWKKWWFYGLGLFMIGGLGLGAGAVYRYRTREYVLPPELKDYVPIESNPYIVGNPIRGEGMFFGRDDDFRYVRTKLEGASQGVVIVFCGDRRTGKSSILYQILNGRLGDRFIPVFIDMQEMVVASDQEFLRRVAKLICEAVGIDKAERDRFGIDDPTLNPYLQFTDFLDEVIDRIGDKGLVLLFDEYELLESKVEEGRLDAEVFLFMAGLMDSKERLSFIFTGSRRLEERDRRYWREMLRRSLFRKISFLSEKDAERLITDPVADRVVYGRGVVGRIVRLTAGQPFYTQVICQTAVDYLNEHKRNALVMRDLNAIVAEIVDHPLPQMIYFWEALSQDEKVVLSLLANRLEGLGPNGWATAAEIRAFVRKEKMPVDLSENTIHLTLEELFRVDVLEKSPFESYRFKIDLFRIWIRRSHSIWEVLKGT